MRRRGAPLKKKADYRKLTVTLPPALYRVLVQEHSRRKIAGERGFTLSAIVTEWLTSRTQKRGVPHV